MVYKVQTSQSPFVALFGFALVPLLFLLPQALLLVPQGLKWYISGASDLSSAGGKDREGSVCRTVRLDMSVLGKAKS